MAMGRTAERDGADTRISKAVVLNSLVFGAFAIVSAFGFHLWSRFNGEQHVRVDDGTVTLSAPEAAGVKVLVAMGFAGILTS